MEMKRRGADRVLGIDFDEDYLKQARFAAEVRGLDIEFRQMSVYDVAALREKFDLVFFIGVLYHLRHPLLALDLIHQHVAGDLMVFQSLQRGSNDIEPVAEDYDFFAPAPLRPARLPQAAFHREQLRPRQHQLVGPQPRLLGRDAPLRWLHHRSQPGRRNFYMSPWRTG